jgi:hypothetical protein
MKHSGVLKEFNAAFERRRMEAAIGGKGFMTYASIPAHPPPIVGGTAKWRTAPSGKPVLLWKIRPVSRRRVE